MGYEDAPACKLLATHCCCCGRPLLDAKSVQYGIGPDCRRKYGFNDKHPEDARKLANKVIYEIALMASDVKPETPEALRKACDELIALDFGKIAARVMERVAKVAVEEAEGRLAVDTPYSPDVVDAFRRIAGRKWDKERKLNTFPAAARTAIWAVFKRFYPGSLGRGPKGLFVIPTAEVKPPRSRSSRDPDVYRSKYRAQPRSDYCPETPEEDC